MKRRPGHLDQLKRLPRSFRLSTRSKEAIMTMSLSMKQVVLVALGTSMVAACGGQGSEEIEKVSSALGAWTAWVSDGTAPWACNPPYAATKAACRGRYCDDMALF